MTGDPIVESFALANDTGTPGDGVTADATLVGTVSAGDMAGVQFDFQADGVFDAEVLADSQGAFNYDSSMQLGYGSASVRARAMQWDSSSSGYRYGDWTAPLNFTFAPEPVAAPSVSLANDTGAAGDGVTSDPTIHVTAGANQLIELDFDADGISDYPASTDSEGNLTLDLEYSLSYGEVQIRARAGQWDSIQQEYRFSDWSEPLAFTYAPEPVAAPTLALANDTGTAGDHITADATLTGTAGASQLVELDLNGDGAAELTAYADANGDFSFVGGSPIPEGSVNARARAGEYDTHLAGYHYSQWSTPISFVYENIEPWEVPTPTLSLVNDNGAPYDNITSDGRLTGTTGANLSVALDYNGDGTTDQLVTANAEGQFIVDASSNFADGPVTVYARSAMWSEALAAYVYSDSTSLGFSYYDNLAPEILTFNRSQNATGVWTVFGTVRDDHNGVNRVNFGGILADHFAVVENGQFSFIVPVGMSGLVTAQCEDEYHVGSNVEWTYIG
jgi:hypothetical protein